MKLIIMAAALTLGGTVLAQAAGAQTGGAMDAVAQAYVCSGPKEVAPDNSAPRRDARGIVVVSAPAMAPDCYNESPRRVPPGTSAPLPTAPGGSAPDLEACTATRTDHCKQTYERRRPG